MPDVPTNDELRQLGYTVHPPYIEGDDLPSLFWMIAPDGRRYESILDTNLWAIGRWLERKKQIVR